MKIIILPILVIGLTLANNLLELNIANSKEMINQDQNVLDLSYIQHEDSVQHRERRAAKKSKAKKKMKKPISNKNKGKRKLKKRNRGQTKRKNNQKQTKANTQKKKLLLTQERAQSVPEERPLNEGPYGYMHPEEIDVSHTTSSPFVCVTSFDR